MRTVPLHGKKAAGRVALVDDDDYDLVMQYRWLATHGENGEPFYAYRLWSESGRTRGQYMHMLITGYALTDHEDHDGLNNQRYNLREGTGGGNQRNTRKLASGTSRFKGVCWDKSEQKWYARICVNGKQSSLGKFAIEERAARVYDLAARENYGEFAWLNFPDMAADAPDPWPPEPGRRGNAAKTHCLHGHEYTEENTYLTPPDKEGLVHRKCRTCERARERARKQKKAAELVERSRELVRHREGGGDLDPRWRR